MTARENDRTQHKETEEHFFKSNAVKMIHEMSKLSREIQEDSRSALIDEMLHSIFFLGKILKDFSPEDIIADKEMLENLNTYYPRPFRCYQTHFPRRSPFSCVLDMIVLHKNPENEEQIKQSLQRFARGLDPEYLVSSTICISQKSKTDQNSKRYYGVSMSTKGPNTGQIVIAASCLNNWHEYVSGAVMTYYPEMDKKNYFDGTIKVPKNIRCEAFDIRSGNKKDPCRSCHNLFGLNTEQIKEWDYGNCAEAESLSNLLKNEEEVKKKTNVNKYSAENRKKAEKEVHDNLMDVLKRNRDKNTQRKGFEKHLKIYNPESE
ncbi:uncharacterized protein LOC109196335 [Oreochromis niloticus]|uniref:uncharacterized protein LOC109196335 n=1 Tax=Oreochromis niloticus TaxID=8128 RepID=UPI0009048A02|nr:uncharacterized protein LOC109196335 [Oreochromis niloticus]